MSTHNGPLGKYSQQVAAVVAVGTIASAIALRFFNAPDPFIDNLALIAAGAVFGAAASTSVNGNKIEAAHRRLDILSAPPADSLEARAVVEYEAG
jgi:hypothetical protein